MTAVLMQRNSSGGSCVTLCC